MLPVKSNLTDKACGDVTGSNCVIWTGGQLCSTILCKGENTLTDVITAIDNKLCGSNTDTPPCYTGQWVDFTANIPTSGSGSGYSWIINNFAFASGISGSSITYPPQYKWTKDGNLLMRGGFTITANVTVTKQFIIIPTTVNILPCAAPGLRAQYVLNNMDANPSDTGVGDAKWFYHGIEPTGIITFVYVYSKNTLGTVQLDVDLGGTQFNIA